MFLDHMSRNFKRGRVVLYCALDRRHHVLLHQINARRGGPTNLLSEAGLVIVVESFAAEVLAGLTVANIVSLAIDMKQERFVRERL